MEQNVPVLNGYGRIAEAVFPESGFGLISGCVLKVRRTFSKAHVQICVLCCVAFVWTVQLVIWSFEKVWILLLLLVY
jgi:hypothetical protein